MTNDLSKISPYDLLDKLKLSKPPFNPFIIAEKLGLEVDQSLDLSNLNLSGSITNKNGNVKIWINPLDSEGRQRFTLAHELGHYVYDILTDGDQVIQDTPETLYRNNQRHTREYRANDFAGMLLMPKFSIIEEATNLIEASPQQSLPTIKVIEKLAEIFEVSKPAMLVRLKKLNIVDQDYKL